MSEPSRDLHRAICSLMEELQAIDSYQQRVDATQDPALRAVLGHNRDEEIEHAMMLLEWLRRRNPTFDAHIRTYLMSERPITELEATPPSTTADAGAATGTARDGALGVGSLRAAPATPDPHAGRDPGRLEEP